MGPSPLYAGGIKGKSAHPFAMPFALRGGVATASGDSPATPIDAMPAPREPQPADRSEKHSDEPRNA